MKHASATFAGSFASPTGFPTDGLPEVAFLGRSNVGKSSLLNALAGTRGLARVSAEPGRTRLVSFFRLEGVPRPGGRGRDDLYLVDLPGYGYAKASRDVRAGFEKIAVSYLLGREALRLCVFIVDLRHPPGERDLLLRDWLEHHRLPYAIAANKADALSRPEAVRSLRQLASGPGRGASAAIATSALRGTGIDELWNEIRAAAFTDRSRAESGTGGEPAASGRTVLEHGR